MVFITPKQARHTMRFEINEAKTYVKVYRESDDPRMNNLSQLIYNLKKIMHKAGYKGLIKKDLSKEPGNMLSEGCYGLIVRRACAGLEKGDQIHDSEYVLTNDAAMQFNQTGYALLHIN